MYGIFCILLCKFKLIRTIDNTVQTLFTLWSNTSRYDRLLHPQQCDNGIMGGKRNECRSIRFNYQTSSNGISSDTKFDESQLYYLHYPTDVGVFSVYCQHRLLNSDPRSLAVNSIYIYYKV